jgi:hypothetical protein
MCDMDDAIYKTNGSAGGLLRAMENTGVEDAESLRQLSKKIKEARIKVISSVVDIRNLRHHMIGLSARSSHIGGF